MEDFQAVLQRRAEARVGTVLRGKWRIQRVLGVGGMATVFAATHRNGKRGAVKMLHRELCVDPSVRSRFLREGYVANTVDHPGSVSVLDDDFDDDAVFLVMELLDGQSLDAVVRSRPSRRLEVGEVLVVADAALDVLAAAHEKGIVHRDLKPENLFLTTRGEIKVLDFGIARLHDASGGVTGRTKDGSQMGTPAYMPPEQALGEWDAVTASSDLWALGATLFSLITGRVVHPGDTTNQVLLAAMTKPAPKVASIAPAVPADVAALIDRALEKEPRDRWEDARAMQREVRRIQEHLGLSGVKFVPEPEAPVEAQPVEAQPAASPTRAEAPFAKGDTPVEVAGSSTVVDPPVEPALPAVAAPEPTPPLHASVEGSDEPARTVPGLTTDPPQLPVRSATSRRRLLLGAALVVVLGGATALTVSLTDRREPRVAEPAASAASEPARAAAAATATEPTVEPAEPASSASSEPSATGAVPAGAPRPLGSASRPGSKPASTGDPFNRWK